MTIFPFHNNEAMDLSSRVSKLKPSTILAQESGQATDIVSISAEGKKRQILDQARIEVLERIRAAK